MSADQNDVHDQHDRPDQLDRHASEFDRLRAHFGMRPQESGEGTFIRQNLRDEHGTSYNENAYWNFNVGLALRFFAALRASPDPALQQVACRHRDRIELLELVLHRQLRRSITEREGCVEIRTSIYSGETNSETQPWVMLGLLGHPHD